MDADDTAPQQCN
jgi:hypothetical protein